MILSQLLITTSPRPRRSSTLVKMEMTVHNRDDKPPHFYLAQFAALDASCDK